MGPFASVCLRHGAPPAFYRGGTSCHSSRCFRNLGAITSRRAVWARAFKAAPSVAWGSHLSPGAESGWSVYHRRASIVGLLAISYVSDESGLLGLAGRDALEGRGVPETGARGLRFEAVRPAR